MTSSKYLVRLVVLATVLLTLASLVFAQDYRGKVQGFVKDENGSAILGAQVVLRNVKTGVEVTRNSDSEGRFVFDFVDPGDYVLMAEQTGFKKAVQENI
ncbi:MAG TPA: carboxypeptidase-like regulatory domain-containing protein, partial [Pyrinomonadaceae bacterium]